MVTVGDFDAGLAIGRHLAALFVQAETTRAVQIASPLAQ